LACVGIPHHYTGSVDAPGDGALLAHSALGLVLGLEIGHVEVLCLIEHVFTKEAVEQTGHCDGAAMMEAASAESFGQLQRLTGALSVDLLLNARLGVEVIDGSEMEEVIDMADEWFLLGGAHSELGMG